jgi:hypothetical protein
MLLFSAPYIAILDICFRVPAAPERNATRPGSMLETQKTRHQAATLPRASTTHVRRGEILKILLCVHVI